MLLDGATVPAGDYEWMRLIDFNLRKSVVQPPGQQADATTCGGQAYLLKPVLRVVDNLQVGTISGNVDPNLVAAGNCPTSSATPGAVYLYGPYGATDTALLPDDLDENPLDGDPITTANVDATANYSYTIGFVPAGNYVVAYTCDADDSTQDANAEGATEVVTFTPAAGKTVTVSPNATSPIDFP